jgi:MFS family permease
MAQDQADPGLSAAEKRLVLVAAILGTTVVTVDSTVVNIALPAIADDLGGGLAGQQWTSNAYLVTLGSLLLIGGSLGDLFGGSSRWARRCSGSPRCSARSRLRSSCSW